MKAKFTKKDGQYIVVGLADYVKEGQKIKVKRRDGTENEVEVLEILEGPSEGKFEFKGKKVVYASFISK